MINQSKIFSSFSVNNLEAAKEFYRHKLGLEVKELDEPGCGKMLKLKINKESEVLIYPKVDHIPATFTVLNFGVNNIEDEVRTLHQNGINFEKFHGTDDLGINHSEGPLIAWFKDPAGNFLSVIENEEEAKTSWDMEKTTFIPGSVREVFRFWTEPALLEQWSAPEEMKLKIPAMENRAGGQYRFEHTGNEGVYVCEGVFVEYKPEEKLVQRETVRGPDGKILFEDLECIVTFNEKNDGTEVSIVQRGFNSREARDMCDVGWDQCLEKLNKFFGEGFYVGEESKKEIREDKLTDFY